MSGFTTGAAMSIGLSQLKNAFGFLTPKPLIVPQQGLSISEWMSLSLSLPLFHSHYFNVCFIYISILWLDIVFLFDSYYLFDSLYLSLIIQFFQFKLTKH